MPKCSLKSRASSPIVMPCRIGIGNWPTNDSLPGTEHRPFDVDAADRVRPVADDDRGRRASRTRAGSWPSCRCRCRCARRCPAGRRPARRRPQHLRRSARASRCRASTPAPCAGSRRVRRLDHVVLHDIAPTVTPGGGHQRIDDVRVVRVDRRGGIADDGPMRGRRARRMREDELNRALLHDGIIGL